MTTFRGTPNKTVIRNQWDAPLLAEFSSRIQRKLSYFGLPGPRMLDLRSWKNYLHYCSGVERLRKHSPYREEDLEAHRQMFQNAALYDLDSRFELLRGDIEDVIITGKSLDGKYPAYATSQGDRLLFHYDLVNLDFFGGLGVRNKQGKARRVRAIKMLLDRQCGTDFLLLLTLNVRDRLEDELTDYLLGAQRDATTADVRSLLDWYATRGEGMREYKLKAMVPLFMRREAGVHEFESIAYPPISYVGDGDAHMVHFAFELRHRPTNFHIFAAQTDVEIINLPLLKVVNEQLVLANHQHPRFEWTLGSHSLRFLPEPLRSIVITLNTTQS